MTVNEAGRRGGLSVLRRYGRTHFVRLGRSGQSAMRAQYPNKARDWGKMGGRPKKANLEQTMGESGNKKKEQ